MTKQLGRVMWISPTGGTATVEGDLHSEQQLMNANYKQVHVFTSEELRSLVIKTYSEGISERGNLKDYLKELGL